MFEFSPRAFDDLLRSIHGHGYRVLTFDQLKADRPAGSKVLLLRHDVDVSMDYAYAMARHEAQQGVRATYFVMLRSPLYNLWSRHAVQSLRAIVAMGHAIGLHFDASAVGPEKSLKLWIRLEVDALEALVDAPVRAFSLHQPAPEIIAQQLEIAGLINTYHHGQMAGFHYISDSNRKWLGHEPLAALTAGFDALHLLLHPIWWMRAGGSVADCWDDAILLNFVRAQEQLLATERAYGPARQFRIIRQDQV